MHDAVRSALEAVLDGQVADSVESATLDFKEAKGAKKELLNIVARAAICLANAQGGHVVVGVADRVPGAAGLTGTTLLEDEVTRRVYQTTEPRLTVAAEAHVFEGVRLLVITVPRSVEIHCDNKGQATRRVGTECLPIMPAEVALLREARAGHDWSAQPSDRDVEAIDPAALAAAKSWVARLPGDRRKLAAVSDLDFLRALGVLTPEGVLLRAGEVLFCAPRAGSPRVVYLFSNTPGGEPRAVRIESPGVVAFERLEELVVARSGPAHPINLPGGQQLLLEDLPIDAVREAFINALIHRDYRLPGPITVEHSPQVFVVTSPGSLVGGVTVENILTHPSTPRNRTLALATRTLGLAEEVGRGVDRMYREMIRTGRATPEIVADPHRVRVSLVGGAPSTQVARFVAQLPETTREDTDALLTLHTLRTQRTVEAASMASTLQKPKSEAEMVLSRLAADEVALLEPTRKTARRAHPRYRLRGHVLKALGTAVAYNRRTKDEMDEKMIALVREYGHVTNSAIRNLLDVNVTRARDLLADWKKRGLLVRTSAHSRGPNVQYGAGPAFPKRRRRT